MKKTPLKGSLTVPGDKSISHRALIFSSFTEGETEISNCSPAVDCLSSAECLEHLGLRVEFADSQRSNEEMSRSARGTVLVKSPGIHGLSAPQKPLFAGNSGTTMRLLSGLLAGQSFVSVLDGDESLRKRPMGRVLKPLIKMGASVKHLRKDDQPKGADQNQNGSRHAPFEICGDLLQGDEFHLEIASAQVQTAILLAGLQAEGQTRVVLPQPVRDHTIRMFRWMEIPFDCSDDFMVTVKRLSTNVKPKAIEIPADISSAAFMLVAASLIEESDLLLQNVGINEGRLLVIDVLKRMGADITFTNRRDLGFEPVADVRVRYAGRLVGTTISGAQIAKGIDEIPILALAGAFCQGSLIVRDAAELKHKESNRLAAIIDNLKAAGADIVALEDGFEIQGSKHLPGGSRWQTFLDHRLAMTGMIAELVCEEGLTIEETDSVKISYPSFGADLGKLQQ
jgi:3-phosphoshikimate 1-carboxyvinyltransferase